MEGGAVLSRLGGFVYELSHDHCKEILLEAMSAMGVAPYHEFVLSNFNDVGKCIP